MGSTSACRKSGFGDGSCIAAPALCEDVQYYMI